MSPRWSVVDAGAVLATVAAVIATQGLGRNGGLTAATLALAAVLAALAAAGRWQAAPLALACTVAAVAPWLLALPSLTVVVAGVLLAGVAAVLLWAMPVPLVPRPGGPHAVGRRRFELTIDDSPLVLYAWYPSAHDGTRRAQPYQTRAESVAAAAAAVALGAPRFLSAHLRLAAAPVSDGSALAPSTAGWPLVVFNHGAVSAPTHCSILLSELASHGYVCVAIGRPGESSGIVGSDHTVTPVTRAVLDELIAAGRRPENVRLHLARAPAERRAALTQAAVALADTYPASATARWATSSRRVVDRLLAGEVPPEARELAASLDRDRLAYAGMSLGGSVAHACCMTDPRARAGINLDGCNWSFAAIEQAVPTPMLNLAGDARYAAAGQAAGAPAPTTPACNDFYYEPAAAAGLREDVVRILVAGAAHGDFTDFPLSARGFARRRLGGGAIDPDRVLQLVASLCVGFLECHLRGRHDALAQALARFPEALRQDLAPLRDWARRA